MAGPKLLILPGIVYSHPQALAVLEMITHRIGAIPHHQHESVNSCLFSPEDDMLQERPARY